MRKVATLCGLLIATAMAGCSRVPPVQVRGGEPARGKTAIERRGCVACHAIPGVAGYQSDVGPPLNKMAKRSYIGGVLANTPDNMVRWLREPTEVDPRTAMPDMDIGEAEARDIAAYLYTLD